MSEMLTYLTGDDFQDPFIREPDNLQDHPNVSPYFTQEEARMLDSIYISSSSPTSMLMSSSDELQYPDSDYLSSGISSGSSPDAPFIAGSDFSPNNMSSAIDSLTVSSDPSYTAPFPSWNDPFLMNGLQEQEASIPIPSAINIAYGQILADQKRLASSLQPEALSTVTMSDVVPDAPSNDVANSVKAEESNFTLSKKPTSPIRRRASKSSPVAPAKENPKVEVMDEGEDEIDAKEDDGEDCDDSISSYTPSLSSSDSYSPPRSTTRSGTLLSAIPTGTSTRKTRGGPSFPTPVPNLTKKSRGRKVPTTLSDEESSDRGGRDKNRKGLSSRPYVCMANGCGKVFVRGEHLKRHVRSIHTNEKPYLCPSASCSRRFSRRDNLRQHLRVHKR